MACNNETVSTRLVGRPILAAAAFHAALVESSKSVLTVPHRFAKLGDPHAGIDAAPGSLERLLELAARDDAEGR